MQVAVIADVGELSVQRYFLEPARLRPAIRNAVQRALPLAGLTDPHAGESL